MQHWNDKIILFESKKNPKDQNLFLVNSIQNQSIHRFNSQYFQNNSDPLMCKNDFRDIIWLKDFSIFELKYFGFPNDKIQNLIHSTLSLLIKVSRNEKLENENIGMILNGDQILSFPLPKFNSIKCPNQLLFHHDLGLICLDYFCFTECEQLLISEKEEEKKDEEISNIARNWVQIPVFEKKKV